MIQLMVEETGVKIKGNLGKSEKSVIFGFQVSLVETLGGI